MSLDRFEELHERLTDGQATEAEQRELAALLQSDATLRRRLVDRSLEEVQLRKILTGAAGAEASAGGEHPLHSATVALPIPFWRVAMWTAAAALLLCAASYALWQLQAEKPSAPQQAYVPIKSPDLPLIPPFPPLPPEQKWTGTPTVTGGKLLVDGVENGPIHFGSVLINPAAPGGATVTLEEQMTSATLVLAPGTQVVWQPDTAHFQILVHLNAGRLSCRSGRIDESPIIETAQVRFFRPVPQPPEVDRPAAEFTVTLTGPMPMVPTVPTVLPVQPGQTDRRRVTLTVEKDQVEVTKAGSAANAATEKLLVPAGQQRIFRAGRLSRHVEENEADEEHEEHDGGREEEPPAHNGGNAPVPTEPSAQPDPPAAPEKEF